MAQVIQTICDPCQADGEQTPATPLRINDVEVDICDEHMKTITLFDLISSLEQGYYAARPAAKPSAEDGPTCPHGCNKGKPFKSIQGLRQHMTRTHRETV